MKMIGIAIQILILFAHSFVCFSAIYGTFLQDSKGSFIEDLIALILNPYNHQFAFLQKFFQLVFDFPRYFTLRDQLLKLFLESLFDFLPGYFFPSY